MLCYISVSMSCFSGKEKRLDPRGAESMDASIMGRMSMWTKTSTWLVELTRMCEDGTEYGDGTYTLPDETGQTGEEKQRWRYGLRVLYGVTRPIFPPPPTNVRPRMLTESPRSSNRIHAIVAMQKRMIVVLDRGRVKAKWLRPAAKACLFPASLALPCSCLHP